MTKLIICKILCAIFLFFPFGVAVHAAEQIDYEYDALGRLIKVDYSTANRVAQYCYDAAGNRTELKVTTSGATCPAPTGGGSGGSGSGGSGSGGGGSSGPIQITLPGTLTVDTAHTATYNCSISSFFGSSLEICTVLPSGYPVYVKVGTGAAIYDAGYSGRLEVTQAAYGTGQP